MLAQAASLLNVDVVILDVGENAPAKQVIYPRSGDLAHVDGSFTDSKKIKELAAKVDVLTVEIEHVDVSVLQEVETAVPLGVHPNPSTIRIIQDKFVQKQHLAAHNSPISTFVAVESTVTSVVSAAEKLGLPLMLKSRTLAYDGRGNYVVRDLAQAQDAIDALGGRPLYAEKWVPFVKEIAVMVIRSASGEIASYPVVETVHRDNICHLVFAPLRTRDVHIANRARDVAEAAVRSFEGAGIFGVEMFLTEDGASPILLTTTSILTSNRRIGVRQRDCPPSAQLRSLHHRGLRNFPVREPPARHSFPSSRINCAPRPVRGDAQPSGGLQQHVRY